MMKKITIYIPVFFLVFTLLFACNDDFDPVFDKSASERITEVFNNCSATLTSSEFGWDMHYFVDTLSGGYNLLMDFTSNSDVAIAGRNNITNNSYLEAISSYEMNNSNGPILSFNTYNDVLHPFADPDGLALGGDYEFVIVSVTDTVIKLKGKKNNTITVLNRITEGSGKEAYLDEIDEMRNKLFSEGTPDYMLEINGTLSGYTFSEGISSVFAVENDNDTVVHAYPFITTPKGFRLYKPENISGLAAQTFILNDDNSALVSIESPDVKLIGTTDIVEYFSKTSIDWRLDSGSMSNDIKIIYDKISNSVADRYSGATDFYLSLIGIPSNNHFSLRLSFIYKHKTVVADVYFDYQTDNSSSITFSYNGSGNSAGEALIQSISGYNEMVQLISTRFDISTHYPLNIYDIIFTKSSNNGSWFRATR